MYLPYITIIPLISLVFIMEINLHTYHQALFVSWVLLCYFYKAQIKVNF